MGKVYKIHPAIGVARIGNHPSAFFVGPEKPRSPGVEIAADGSETAIAQYKDAGQIKRQAARFRVFEFDQDDHGNLQLARELTADDAKIDWTVNLCNRKAALDHSPAPGHPAKPRNKDIADRASLIIKNDAPVSISGKSEPAKEFNGRFLGKPVYLGELRTDGKGRLLVLGGRGKSESVPVGQRLPSFANNDKWHDDVSDGPVTATVTFAGQQPIAVHHSSWVVVAPPDFAPGIDSIVTLYDVAYQAAIDKGALKPEAEPSFERHIKPLIERARSLRWVNKYDDWSTPSFDDLTALADPSAANATLRQEVANRLQDPSLSNFVMPNFLITYVEQWAAGNFVTGANDIAPIVSVVDELDRAALDACVGNNFFPGIEASLNLRDRDIYARPFRLDFTNIGKVYPGCLSEIMAVPWQADFMDCDSGFWWPSQRPDIAMTDPANIPGSKVDWADPLPDGDHQGMVDHVLQMGFVVPVQQGEQTVFVERERDPDYKRQTPTV